MRFLRLALRISGLAPLLRRHRRDDRRLPLEARNRRRPSRRSASSSCRRRAACPSCPTCRRSSASGRAARRGRRGRRRPCASARRPWPPSPRRASAAAFSTSPTMSPMPRMRPAMRAGSKSSSASSFSPTPISLIGLPVTARIDSAAPPRPSPSTRVSTMPVMPDPLVERVGEVDRVLAGERVGDQQNLVRVGGRLDLGHLDHQRLVDVGAAGGVEDDHVVAAEPRRVRSRVARSPPATGRRRSAACRCRPARRAPSAAPAPPAGACRARPSGPCASRGRRAAARSSPPSSSCPSPAGRPASAAPAPAR